MMPSSLVPPFSWECPDSGAYVLLDTHLPVCIVSFARLHSRFLVVLYAEGKLHVGIGEGSHIHRLCSPWAERVRIANFLSVEKDLPSTLRRWRDILLFLLEEGCV